MCTRNSGQSRRKRRICSRRQVCSAELRLMTMEEGTAVLESYTVVRTSGVANQDGRCLSVPSVRPMSWFDLVFNGNTPSPGRLAVRAFPKKSVPNRHRGRLLFGESLRYPCQSARPSHWLSNLCGAPPDRDRLSGYYSAAFCGRISNY